MLAAKESLSDYTHAENLTNYIVDVTKEAGLSLNNIDAIAVSKGPGSYMGLRIGVASAKGLCYALDKPLLGIDTLQAMALKAAAELNDNTALFCPMIDARRMEVYCAVYNSDNELLEPVSAKIIDEDSFRNFLTTSKMYFFGDGAAKCSEVLKQPPLATFNYAYKMSADAMIPLALEQYNMKKFESLANFEPFYLKDFIPGLPKVKGLT